MYTEKQVGTWQSIPDLETEQGDFSGEPQILSTTNQDREGVGNSTAQSNHREQWASFADQPGIDTEINNPTATSNSPNNQRRMPPPINLETSGSCRSSRTEVLARRGLVYSNTTLTNQDKGMTKPQPAHLCSASQQNSHLKSALVLFSTICSFGYGLSCMAHSLQENVSTTSTSTFSNAIDSYHCMNTLYDGTINCFSTLAKSNIASNETFSYNQALKQEDFCEFIKAMTVEVSDHESRDHWTLTKRCDMPEDTKTIMSIWSFKRKRYPNGTLNKHKACLCAHGGMQTWGQNYWETYAPVVNWASVRLILAIAKIHGLSSKRIDFALAFPQADLEIPVYMELPIGFDAPEGEYRKSYVLRLNKSLYGLKQAGYNWFAELSNGLQDRGFVQSSIDPCVFFNHNCIVLTYVDDCIIIGVTHDRINLLIQSLHKREENFVLQDEGSIEKYLGVEIKQRDASSFELTQPFLIEQITKFLGIDNGKTNEKLTPVSKPLLNKDLDGVRKYDWEYRGAIGMLTYLTGSIQPDIAMAVHQCAGFSSNPMHSHEQAVMRIGRYLLST